MQEDSKQLQPGTENLSLPLYAGGLAVSLCGVQAVASSMSQTDITVVATLLTLLGFGFSLACRKLKVQPRVIEIACMGLIVAFAYLFFSQQLNLAWFLRGADKAEDQIAACLMWSAVIWSWTLIADDNIMFSCVLATAMIGLTGTSNVNTPVIVYFCLFVLAMLFLLIHHNFLQSRSVSAARADAKPPARLRLLEAQALIAILCAAVVLGLATVVVVPAQALLANLSLAQAVRQFVSSGHSGDAALVVGTQFSDDVSLDVGRGSQWPTGTETVMRVTPSDKMPHYWRGRTYDLYVGDGWQSTQNTPLPLQWQEGDNQGTLYPITAASIPGEGDARDAAPSLAPPPAGLSVTFDVHGETNQFYYTDEPRQLTCRTSEGIAPRLSPDGLLDLADRSVRGSYQVVCDPTPDAQDSLVQARLRRAGTHYPARVRQLYLHPLSGPDNPITNSNDALYFQTLLQTIFAPLPATRRTPLDKALAIREWVASNCTYSLSVSALPDGVDHVRAFLESSRTGYCDLFASAVVVLCRAANIPARMATGFAPGEQDGSGYNLRAMDKHAWAEVYFPGTHWVILDATVGSHADASVPTGRTENVGFGRALWRGLTQSGPLPLLLLLCIAALLGWIGKNELWDRYVVPRRRLPRAANFAAVRARTDWGRRWAGMTRELGRLGLPPRPSETPAEYAARAALFLREQERVTGIVVPVNAIDTLSGQFALSRYGNGAADASGADAALSELTHAVRRARRVQVWHRVRQAFGAG